MSHLEQLKAAFTALGIEFTERPLGPSDVTEIRIDEGNGYGGFFHTFDFHPDGRFLAHGAYE